MIFKCCYFLQRAHSIEQAPLTMVMPSGTHFTADSTEAMQIKSLAQGHDKLTLPGFKTVDLYPETDILTTCTMYSRSLLILLANTAINVSPIYLFSYRIQCNILFDNSCILSELHTLLTIHNFVPKGIHRVSFLIW